MQSFVLILSICLSIAVVPGEACSITGFWEPQSFEDRLEQASLVFSGRVIHTTDRSSFGDLQVYNPFYKAVFEVDCFYKGGLDTKCRYVKVGTFGSDGGLCVAAEVEDGESYIIFARTNSWSDSELSLDNINIQSGATVATPDIIAAVEQKYSCA